MKGWTKEQKLTLALKEELLEPPDRGCKSTMIMSKWDIRSILESMVNIQRHAGVTIAGILDEAVFIPHVISPSLGHCTWNCKESPVMLCVYDSDKDPAMDKCLYCGEPDQRK